MTIQYRVTFGKNDEAVHGADDADVALGAQVAFMQGKLKSSGSTGELLAALADGSAGAVLSRLASRP